MNKLYFDDNELITKSLKQYFFKVACTYSDSTELMQELWQEIVSHYQQQERYYHNLTHISEMFFVLWPVRNKITDFNTLSFAIFYHDIIYEVTRNDNEVKSAEKAAVEIKKLDVPVAIISKCYSMITATCVHQSNGDNDTDYLLDADLCILGKKDEKDYWNYSNQVRKEYALYADDVYKQGRINVLEKFLDSDHIFKTQHFYHLYEGQARTNIRRELEDLTKAK